MTIFNINKTTNSTSSIDPSNDAIWNAIGNDPLVWAYDDSGNGIFGFGDAKSLSASVFATTWDVDSDTIDVVWNHM